jgi:hypothetical protein
MQMLAGVYMGAYRAEPSLIGLNMSITQSRSNLTARILGSGYLLGCH